jgi:hypothetical protein
MCSPVANAPPLRCAPVAPEVVSETEDEILDEEDLAVFDGDHRDAAVLAIAALPVRELEVPVR